MKVLILLISLAVSISFGQDIGRDVIPGHVDITENTEANQKFCGGVKVGPTTYATAAHCAKTAVKSLGFIEAGKEILLAKKVNKVISIKFPANTLNLTRGLNCDRGCDLPSDINFKNIAFFEVEDQNDIEVAQMFESKVPLNISDEVVISDSRLTMGVVYIQVSGYGHIAEMKGAYSDIDTDPYYSNTVTSGLSGSPIWLSVDGQYKLIGIVSYGNYKKRRVTIVTKEELLSAQFSK